MLVRPRLLAPRGVAGARACCLGRERVLHAKSPPACAASAALPSSKRNKGIPGNPASPSPELGPLSRHPPTGRRGTGSYGLYGQLGDGGPSSRPGGPWTFPQKSNFVGVVAISAGPGITCIANGIGQRLCAGNGQYGQLAKAPNATSQNNTVPVLTVVPGSASDAAGPFATPASFVTISDSTKPVCSLLLTLKVAATCSTTAPVFNPPLQNINAEATSEAGVIVTFNVSANKEGVPVPSTCTPASGFLFPIGDTTVTCTAGSTTGTFVVGCAPGGVGFATRACARAPPPFPHPNCPTTLPLPFAPTLALHHHLPSNPPGQRRRQPSGVQPAP